MTKFEKRRTPRRRELEHADNSCDGSDQSLDQSLDQLERKYDMFEHLSNGQLEDLLKLTEYVTLDFLDVDHPNFLNHAQRVQDRLEVLIEIRSRKKRGVWYTDVHSMDINELYAINSKDKNDVVVNAAISAWFASDRNQ